MLDGADRTLHYVYASGWAVTGARGVLASMMLDAYAVADTTLVDHHFGDACSDVHDGSTAGYLGERSRCG